MNWSKLIFYGCSMSLKVKQNSCINSPYLQQIYTCGLRKCSRDLQCNMKLAFVLQVPSGSIGMDKFKWLRNHCLQRCFCNVILFLLVTFIHNTWYFNRFLLLNCLCVPFKISNFRIQSLILYYFIHLKIFSYFWS